MTILSCSYLPLKKDVIIERDRIPEQLNDDYVDQLKYFSSNYKESLGKKKIKLSKKNKEYFDRTVKKILSHNELLLPDNGKVEVIVIQEDAPIFFSFPGYKIFMSSGLIKKYVTNESLLVSLIVVEVIKSGKNIYEKKDYVPVGYIETKVALDLVKVKSSIVSNLYKWAYVAMKRSGYDGSSVLNLIQIINRNKIDFSWQVGSYNDVSQIEYHFKKFLVAQGLGLEIDDYVYKSSNDFYDFKRNVLRKM
jgi:hypothetical protein